MLSQNLRALLLSIFMIGLGVFLDEKLLHEMTTEEPPNKPAASSQQTTCEDSAQALKDKFKDISEAEIKAYLQTQDANEKLKKADELLGKMMQVFVADLGLHLSQDDMKKFGQLPEPTPPRPSPKEAAPELPTAQAMRPQNLNPSVRRLRVEILNANSEEQMQKITKEFANQDFSKSLQNSTNLTPDEIQNLNGSFEGTISWLDPQKKPWRATMSFNGQQRDSQVKGKAQVIFFDDRGKQTSNSTSSGDLSKGFSQFSDSILIECGNQYLQLIYFPQANEFRGNLYENVKGQYQLTANIILHH